MPTVTNTVTDAAGDPVEGAEVQIRLIAATPESSVGPAFVDGTDETIVATVNLATDASGDWSTNLVGNDDITPAGTYYVITERDASSSPRRQPVKYRIDVPAAGGPYWVGDLIVDAPDAIDSSAATAHVGDSAVHHTWARQFLTAG